MRSRLFFRENGRVIRTHSCWRDAALILAAYAGLLGLLAWGYAVDNDEERLKGFESGMDMGLLMGHAQMQDSVGDAYRQGVRDALSSGCQAVPQDHQPAVPEMARGARGVL